MIRKVADQNIRYLVAVNGVRVIVENGTWSLVRASSNKPELVVCARSCTPLRWTAKAVAGKEPLVHTAAEN